MNADNREARWASIQEKMADAAEQLERQGSVASRLVGRRRRWSLRFVDRRNGARSRQRAVDLGDDVEILGRARDLLNTYRQRGRWAKEAAMYAQLGATIVSMAQKAAGIRRRRTGSRGRSWL